MPAPPKRLPKDFLQSQSNIIEPWKLDWLHGKVVVTDLSWNRVRWDDLGQNKKLHRSNIDSLRFDIAGWVEQRPIQESL